MKTIGLIGGMSWESTQTYYRDINLGIKEKLGGLHSAKIILNSLDFDMIEKLQAVEDWDALGLILSQAGQSLDAAGADFILICTNTMHKVAENVEQATALPLLHIADATGEELIKQSIKTVGLLGTRFTMEQDFYIKRLEKKFGITVLTPSRKERQKVHNVIYNELCLGQINQASKEVYHSIINQLSSRGAEGVILGCTEIGLLVKQEETKVKLFDTALIHAQSAVNRALS